MTRVLFLGLLALIGVSLFSTSGYRLGCGGLPDSPLFNPQATADRRDYCLSKDDGFAS